MKPMFASLAHEHVRMIISEPRIVNHARHVWNFGKTFKKEGLAEAEEPLDGRKQAGRFVLGYLAGLL